MKQHTIVGAELLKNIPYLTRSIPIIRSHHERWDGKGYPDGLAGENIPLAARIVSVADALDAMTSNRVYQEAVGLQQAYQEILDGSGTRYDPTVVRAFEAAWPEIIKKL
jgi:HD-GYP domain-containing protein (c-di-GMP phosphodiesterase class II)